MVGYALSVIRFSVRYTAQQRFYTQIFSRILSAHRPITMSDFKRHRSNDTGTENSSGPSSITESDSTTPSQELKEAVGNLGLDTEQRSTSADVTQQTSVEDIAAANESGSVEATSTELSSDMDADDAEVGPTQIAPDSVLAPPDEQPPQTDSSPTTAKPEQNSVETLKEDQPAAQRPSPMETSSTGHAASEVDAVKGGATAGLIPDEQLTTPDSMTDTTDQRSSAAPIIDQPLAEVSTPVVTSTTEDETSQEPVVNTDPGATTNGAESLAVGRSNDESDLKSAAAQADPVESATVSTMDLPAAALNLQGAAGAQPAKVIAADSGNPPDSSAAPGSQPKTGGVKSNRKMATSSSVSSSNMSDDAKSLSKKSSKVQGNQHAGNQDLSNEIPGGQAKKEPWEIEKGWNSNYYCQNL